jgi:hypothetical protein
VADQRVAAGGGVRHRWISRSSASRVASASSLTPARAATRAPKSLDERARSSTDAQGNLGRDLGYYNTDANDPTSTWRCRRSCGHSKGVRVIKRHGIATGPWDQREDWRNERIARVWRQQGAFPGASGMLEALGCRFGTSLVMELLASGRLGMLEDPWPAAARGCPIWRSWVLRDRRPALRPPAFRSHRGPLPNGRRAPWGTNRLVAVIWRTASPSASAVELSQPPSARRW